MIRVATEIESSLQVLERFPEIEYTLAQHEGNVKTPLSIEEPSDVNQEFDASDTSGPATTSGLVIEKADANAPALITPKLLLASNCQDSQFRVCL